MWNFQSKRSPLRDRMVAAAPEANPHEFIRRYLQAKPQSAIPDLAREQGHNEAANAVIRREQTSSSARVA
jgi:hypothetical protein